MADVPDRRDASKLPGSALDVETVQSLLSIQGYSVPADDLAEITARLNGLVAGLVAYDEHRIEHEEPWNEWPGAPRRG